MVKKSKDIVFDPQQVQMLANYLDPQSETWGNAKQSAISAGYSEQYADNIMALMPKWLSETLGQANLVQQSLINLAEALRDDDNKTIKWDATKFSLSRLSAAFKEKKDITTNNEPITTKDDRILEKVTTIEEQLARELSK